MNIENRVKKIEDVLSTFNTTKYNTVIIVEKRSNSDIWEVIKSGQVIQKGTKPEVELYIKPYFEGGSTIIWNDMAVRSDKLET